MATPLISILPCILFTLSTSTVLSLTTTVFQTPIHSSVHSDVTVYDNVLSKESCDILHKAASISGLSHKAFSRPLSSVTPNTSDVCTPKGLIEKTLDAILTKLGDDSTFVEYWTRQEWRHIEAHADVDEHLAKEQDAAVMSTNHEENAFETPAFRYPENGHVLYLKIGTQVHGPTCIFPHAESGGDLLDDEKEPKEVVIVPAVSGRLLRFQGNALHAVPRPTDLWFKSFVMGAPEYQPEDVWGRSVILFNTWKGDPPKNVPLDDVGSCSPPGFEISCDSQELVNHVEKWIQVPTTQDHTTSRNDDINSCQDSNMSNVKIWLLGNERRRGHPMRTIPMKAKKSLNEALFASHDVSRDYLFQ